MATNESKDDDIVAQVHSTLKTIRSMLIIAAAMGTGTVGVLYNIPKAANGRDTAINELWTYVRKERDKQIETNHRLQDQIARLTWQMENYHGRK